MHIRECVSNQRNKVGNSECIGSLPTASIIEVREHNNLFISQLSMFFIFPLAQCYAKSKINTLFHYTLKCISTPCLWLMHHSPFSILLFVVATMLSVRTRTHQVPVLDYTQYLLAYTICILDQCTEGFPCSKHMHSISSVAEQISSIVLCDHTAVVWRAHRYIYLFFTLVGAGIQHLDIRLTQFQSQRSIVYPDLLQISNSLL